MSMQYVPANHVRAGMTIVVMGERLLVAENHYDRCGGSAYQARQVISCMVQDEAGSEGGQQLSYFGVGCCVLLPVVAG